MANMTHLCERCRRPGPLFHCRAVDEYLCDGCGQEAAREAREEEGEEA